MGPELDRLPDGPLGVAVSGGGDSVALAVLLQRWCRRGGRALAAVTVDHGLRDGSAEEARGVQELSAGLGIGHTIVRWHGWDGQGNLQDAARTARYRLIAEWAREAGLAAVALGHTLDDQAETFVLRLARGSGVDGLSAMAARVEFDGVVFVRPMLSIRRDDLRAFLVSNRHSWVEDPSNADRRFDRVKVRQALGVLEGLGIDAENLVQTAARMGHARAALEQATLDLARDCAEPGRLGDVVLDRKPFAAAPLEIRLRLLAAALNWVSGSRYRPRLAALAPICESITAPGRFRAATLHGCVVRGARGKVLIRREPARAEGRRPLGETPWDGRWLVRKPPPDRDELEIGALGEEGLKQWPEWRDSGFDRELLIASPAIWRGRQLVSALARRGDDTPAMYPKGGNAGFFDTIRTR
ncbi:MAG: tRNA lysidine(34) synthetase TilS [Paracoccaceae bacterium]